MSQLGEWRPLHRKLFVFSVPERERIAGSVLYQPQTNRGSYSGAQDIWILSASNDCRYQWKRGQHCFISDGFEAEPTRLDLWEKYAEFPEFRELRAFVEAVGGTVACQVVHEGSLLGTTSSL